MCVWAGMRSVAHGLLAQHWASGERYRRAVANQSPKGEAWVGVSQRWSTGVLRVQDNQPCTGLCCRLRAGLLQTSLLCLPLASQVKELEAVALPALDALTKSVSSGAGGWEPGAWLRPPCLAHLLFCRLPCALVCCTCAAHRR